MVLWVLNLSRIILSEGLVCSNVFSQAVLSSEHSQGAADSDGCAPWEQGVGV